MREYIHTDGLGKQYPIKEMDYRKLRKQVLKIKAKFTREAKHLKAVCDEINRRHRNDPEKKTYYPTVIIEHTIGKVFGFETDEEWKRMDALFELALNVLNNPDFSEKDRQIAIKVLEQGRVRLDD